MATVVGAVELLAPSGDASTHGKQVLVAATSTPGTELHTAVSGTAYWDSIQIQACNNDSATRALTIEWGGTAAADLVKVDLYAGEGVRIVIPWRRLRSGLVVRAFASVTNVITCHVMVNRYRASQS